MFDQIIHFSIKNKLAIALMVFALIVWGAYSIKNLPIDAVPDITNNQVQIITQAPSLGAQEVEQFITAPIELSMANIAAGSSKNAPYPVPEFRSLPLFLKITIDIYWARQQVSRTIKRSRE